MIEAEIIWHLYALNRKDELSEVLESYKRRHGQLPIRAKISVRCPPELESAIRETLEPLDIRIEKTTYALPKDLWLTHSNGQKPLQIALISFPEEG